MKLRLRSYESKETLKIEAPNSCTLAQLKIILSQTLPNSPSSDSIRLSLNRKDELQSDGQESLNSIGIASGDLIFYFLAHPVNSAPKSDYMDTQDENPNPNSPILQTDMESDNENSSDAIAKFAQDENPNPNSPILQTDMEAENENSDSIAKFTQDENPNPDSLIFQTDMEAENENSSDAIAKSFSVPGFLRKVFAEELRNDSGGDHKLIVTAVHAVLLESGFVGFDRDSNAVITNGLHLSWPNSRRFTLSLFYTLPEIVSGASGGETAHTVVLKFQSLGKAINVYGSLGSGGGMGKSGTRSVRLNEDQLVPLLNVVWAGLCDIADIVIDKDGSLSKEKEVFKFWRTVKDNLALPLLIDICEKSGLALPPCFMRLPTDLKSKILESLPGVEVARVSCLCSELQYLASNDDLWKLKFAEEFGNWTDEVQGSWKKAFRRAWERQNSRKRPLPALYWPATRWRRYDRPSIFPPFPPILPTFGNGSPSISPLPICGRDDLDEEGIHHEIDLLSPPFENDLHTVLHDPANRLRRNFSPPCNLGGLDSLDFV